MANIVRDAVGTQRQFTKQPQETYQSQLRDVEDSSRMLNGSKAEQLAQALNGLGGIYNNYFYKREDRRRLQATDANRIVQMATQEDLQTLSAVELINKYGSKFNLTDNPYAISIIEQMKGKQNNEGFVNYYRDVIAREGYLENAEEEKKRFDSLKKQWYLDHAPKGLVNKQEYDKGFYATNDSDLNNFISAQTESKTQDYKRVRDGEIQSQTGAVIDQFWNDKEKLKDGIQTILNEGTLTGLTETEKMKWLTDTMNAIGEKSGSTDLLKYIADNVYFSVAEGKKISDVMDLADANKIAIAKNERHPNEWTFKQHEVMWKCTTVEELDKLWATYSPEAQDNLRSYYTRVKESLIEGKYRKSQQATGAATGRMDAALARKQLDSLLGLHLHGKTVDIRGLKKEDIEDYIYEKIMALGDKDPGDERTREMGMLLKFPGAEGVAKRLGNAWSFSVMTATADDMKNSSKLESLKQAKDMYKADPALFRSLFGRSGYGDLVDAIDAISAAEESSGEESWAIDIWIKARNNMSDPEKAESAESFANTAIKSAGVNLSNLSNGSAQVSIEADDNLKAMATKTMKVLKLAGLSDEQCVNAVQRNIEKNYFVYDGRAYPKALLAGINSDDPANTLKGFFDLLRESVKGYPSDSIMIRYDSSDNTYTLCSSDFKFSEGRMTFDEIVKRANDTMLAYEEESAKIKAAQEEERKKQVEAAGVYVKGTKWDGEPVSAPINPTGKNEKITWGWIKDTVSKGIDAAKEEIARENAKGRGEI